MIPWTQWKKLDKLIFGMGMELQDTGKEVSPASERLTDQDINNYVSMIFFSCPHNCISRRGEYHYLQIKSKSNEIY